MELHVYNKAIRHLIVLTAFCVGMQLFRMYDTQSTTFIKMAWNLFLAWVPLLIALTMVEAKKRMLLIPLVFTWLLFFPNCPYLITDLIHLGPSLDYHWYDAILFYSFAFTGLMTGILSTLIVFAKLKSYFDINLSRIIIMICMYAAGFGVYAGRFLRWNSWDVAVKPMHLIDTALQHVMYPADYKLAYGVTLLSGSLLFAVFLFFETIVQMPQQTTPTALDVPEPVKEPAKPAPNNKDVKIVAVPVVQ